MFQSTFTQHWEALTIYQTPYLLLFTLVLSLLAAFLILRRKKVQASLTKWTIGYEKKDGEALIKRHGNGFKVLQKQTKKNKIKFMQISIDENINISMPKVISKWQLPHLQQLILYHNKINSIQQLTKSNLANLRVLALNDNYITQIKSLRRINSANLIWIELQNNPIIESYSTLSEMNISSVIYIWTQFFSSDPLQNNDLCSIVKFDSENLIKFHAKSSKRIQINSIKDVIIRRYPNLDLRLDEN